MNVVGNSSMISIINFRVKLIKIKTGDGEDDDDDMAVVRRILPSQIRLLSDMCRLDDDDDGDDQRHINT